MSRDVGEYLQEGDVKFAGDVRSQRGLQDIRRAHWLENKQGSDFRPVKRM